MSQRGRPTKYVAAYAAQAEKLTRLGATDLDVADFFQVTISTIYLWKHTHPRFSEALKRGKDEMDNAVETSLLRRALGYSHDATKIMQNNGEALEVPYIEHHPPDVTACIFWLKNRRPKEWRDRQELAHEGKITLEQLVTQSLTGGD